MTAKQILLDYLETALALNEGHVVFRSSDIQTKVPHWAERVYGERYSPNNFIRRFRELKSEDRHLLHQRGIDSIVEVPSDSRESLWKAEMQRGELPRNYDPKTGGTPRRPDATAAGASGS